MEARGTCHVNEGIQTMKCKFPQWSRASPVQKFFYFDVIFRGKEKMMHTCGVAKAADDVALGFLINGVFNVSLMKSNLFHSHIGSLWRRLKGVDLTKQVRIWS